MMRRGRRRRRRLVAPVVLVLAGLGLGACEPGPPHPLEIQMSLHRDGLITGPGPNGLRSIVLTGVGSCTRQVSVHLMPRTQQGAIEAHTREAAVSCGPTRTEWSRTVELGSADLVPGPMWVRVEACTNPAEVIDEDCVDMGRSITFVEAP